MAQLFTPKANTIARTGAALLGVTPLLVFYAGSTVSRSPYNTNQHLALNQPVPFSHKHHVAELGLDCRFCHYSVEKSKTAGIPGTDVCMTCHSQVWSSSAMLKPVRDSYETGTPIQFSNGDVGWTQLNKLPEFVYFDHSIHIDRGVNCAHCHGDVQDMQITSKDQVFSMSWCLKCHNNPEKYLYKDESKPNQTALEQVFDLYRKVQNAEDLNRREHGLLTGWGNWYKPSAEEIEKGEKLIEEYKVKKAQLADCWTCHR